MPLRHMLMDYFKKKIDIIPMENIKRLSKKLITFFPHKNFLKLFPKSIYLGYILIFSSRERWIYTQLN